MGLAPTSSSSLFERKLLLTVPPTSTDSSVFIRILCGMYGYMSIIRELCSEECARRFLEVSCDQRIFDLCPRAVPGEVWRRATLVGVSVKVPLRYRRC